jgi:hypothetical protein
VKMLAADRGRWKNFMKAVFLLHSSLSDNTSEHSKKNISFMNIKLLKSSVTNLVSLFTLC